MAIFQPIRLSWHSRDFTIPAERVMGAIAVVEEVMTFPEIVRMIGGGHPNISKVARAYGALLRYAGAGVDDDEVYEGLFKPGTMHAQVLTALDMLAAMMLPPSAIVSLSSGAASEGNVARAPKARSKSSKRSSRRPLAAAG
jgi:hypothetical protein